LEIHQDNFYFFKKFIFDISTSKRSKNTKNLISSKKKNNFFSKAFLKHKNKKSSKIHVKPSELQSKYVIKQLK